jgi:putative FmdB family regulatory protein
VPIYEYKCTKCENIDEHFMRHTDPHPSGCLKCHSPVEKIVSQTSFALKGGGWYVTDYKSNSQSKPESSQAPAEAQASKVANEPSSANVSTEKPVSKTADKTPEPKTPKQNTPSNA